jgi:hypothetical protein
MFDRYGFRPFPNKIVQVELENMWPKMRNAELEKVDKVLPPNVDSKYL